ncbi:MAG: tetratricopeptide repeat protein [Candidatus Acidiferrum sp.]
MTDRRHILVELALAVGLLAPSALAQKPAPTPAPPPSSQPSNSSGGAAVPASSQPVQPDMDFVMFLSGRVATDDGTPVPHDASVEVVCNEKVRQKVYASPGGAFNIQLGPGAQNDSVLDASDDPASRQIGSTKPYFGGIPPHDFAKCELRASAAGFYSNRRSLMDLTPSDRNVDVGAIVMERVSKVKGATISAAPYKAPENARKAYEKGLQAEKNGKLADARKYFEQAVEMNPSYASAWFRLGTVLEKENATDSARSAYTKATSIDTHFLPPYLSLASMAYEAQDWTGVLQFTGHIIAVDPLSYGDESVYVVDLDEWSPADAYFFNAVANYKLDRIEEAEKSAVKAEHVDLLMRAPELHLLLAEIFTRGNSYDLAIAELQTFLELAPHAKDGDLVREQMAKLEKLSHSTPSPDKPLPAIR